MLVDKDWMIQLQEQNAILTLDYPLLKDISVLEGIDKIHEYIRCIGFTQSLHATDS